MKCQICKGTITPKKKDDVEILQCKNCNGFWIKSGALNKLIKHKNGDVEYSSIDHQMHDDSHGLLKCAFCDDQAMIKINFIGFSDIILDYCEKCGAYWVDNGEVDKMQKYIERIEGTDAKSSLAEIIMSIFYSLPKV